jgi:hypothetical protein
MLARCKIHLSLARKANVMGICRPRAFFKCKNGNYLNKQMKLEFFFEVPVIRLIYNVSFIYLLEGETGGPARHLA